jgi:hypothetical protein
MTFRSPFEAGEDLMVSFDLFARLWPRNSEGYLDHRVNSTTARSRSYL